MGELREKIITHPRVYIKPEGEKMPTLDYNFIYPITVYSAIHQTMDDNSTSLDQELAAIYRLISNKQDILTGGTPGSIMTWGVNPGQVGQLEVLSSVSSVKSSRSTRNVVSERGIGLALDAKADADVVTKHIHDKTLHSSEEDHAKWDNMTPMDTFEEHVNNNDIHVTTEDKDNWNGKADQTFVEEHFASRINPHNVNAHQVGTYNREEIDQFFESLRESFFNYKNISYNAATNTATLEEYREDNLNPNYVLAYGDELKDLPVDRDERFTYYALKPASDYTSNETQICNIFKMGPGDSEWSQVGTADMTPGDMVIRYPDTALCVWIEGRFIILFTTSSSFPSGDFDGFLWRPKVDDQGFLTWTKSSELTPPEPMNIKGEPGYTPKRGVDYYDGAPGIGVPSGGKAGDVIVKTDDDDYATKWVAPSEVGFGEGGSGIEIVQTTGDETDVVMSQKAVTDELNTVKESITDLEGEVGIGNGSESVRKELNDHLSNNSNPHKVTTEQINAVSNEKFGEHTSNYKNPHNVTKEQVGLGNVNNTSDENKPVSIQQKEALDALDEKIDDLYGLVAGDDLITNIEWNNAECKLIFTYHDGKVLEIELPIVNIFNTIYYNNATGDLVVTLPDGTQHNIPIKELVATYEGGDTDNVEVDVTDGVIKAHIKASSVTGTEIQTDVLLRGSPTTTTQIADDNSDKIATTKFVKDVVVDRLDSIEQHRPLSANMGRLLNLYKTSVGDVMNILADTPMLNVVDNLTTQDQYAALSANMGHQLFIQKAPLVHTSPSSSRFGRATSDLFGHVRATNVDPLMDGDPFVGTDNGYFARGDHRHPIDISRAPLFWPDNITGATKLLGEPRAVTPPVESNDDRIATTEWVKAKISGTDIMDQENGTLKGDVKAPTPSRESNDGSIATTEWVKDRIDELDNSLDEEQVTLVANREIERVIDPITDTHIWGICSQVCLDLGFSPAADDKLEKELPQRLTFSMKTKPEDLEESIKWLREIGDTDAAARLDTVRMALVYLTGEGKDKENSKSVQFMKQVFKDITGVDYNKDSNTLFSIELSDR